jgi:hypothetical protein
MSAPRRPQNAAEAQFYDEAIEEGWLPMKRGWPDFFLSRAGEIAVVEIKPKHSKRLKSEQMKVLEALAGFGVPAFRWSPDGGFERIVPDATLGGKGGAVSSSKKTKRGKQQTSLWDGGSGGGPFLASHSEVDAVWAAYVEFIKPRCEVAGVEERSFIHAALKAASTDEVIACIRVCSESDFHMKRGQFKNRKGGKYTGIGKILKPRPRLGETQRSRIEWWLDRAEESGSATDEFGWTEEERT